MTNIRRVCMVVLVPLLGLSGCTVTQLRQDVGDRQHRIEQKENEVSSEVAKSAALRSEMVQLQSDLKERQMSLDELHTRLLQLQRDNAHVAEKTNSQRERKQKLDLQLKKYATDLNALKHDTGLTEAEKKRKIEHLKAEVRKALELMVLL